MQLVIPMTGVGNRFLAAGYKTLKPFILVHNKPIIYWLLKSFQSLEFNNTVIILREDHYKNFPYIKEILKSLAPKAEISLINTYDKLGPLPNILRSAKYIDDHDSLFVSYCDYYMQWNLPAYAHYLHTHQIDGAIPCYSGFHPHLIPTHNLYASCLTDADDNLIEIREKFSFEADKMKSRHSPGVYYLKSGLLLKKYYQLSIDNNQNTNGEFYASLPYNLMVKDGLRVHAPVNVHHFCQWGTPEDLNEYLSWIKIVKGIKK